MVKKTIVFLCLAVSFTAAQAQKKITVWNFNSKPADALSTTGSVDPSVGKGKLLLLGTTATFASGFGAAGTGSSDTTTIDNTAYNTTTYPAQGTKNREAGIAFFVSTKGFENIRVQWDNRHSNTASRWVKLQYTTDSLNWVDYDSTGTDTAGLYRAPLGDTWYNKRSANLSNASGVKDNAKFGFRVVTTFAPGTTNYAAARSTSSYAGGTFRFDMVTVLGDTILPKVKPRDTLVLLSPANNTKLVVKKNDATPISIKWSSLNTVTQYFWKADLPGGDFSKPLVRMASNNQGKDTVLTLSSGAVDALLQSLKIKMGDSIALIWNVVGIAKNDSFTSKLNRNISIKREVVSIELRSPADKTSLVVEKNNPTLINITWSPKDSVTQYFWKADLPGGDFSKPLVRMASNNLGKDTVLTLSSGAIDALLGNLNVKEGDSVSLIWNVVGLITKDSLTSTSSRNISIKRSVIAKPVLKKGDIAIVAYRTSANVDDEFAVLAVNDIPGNTAIRFTDSKFTSNAVPQCSNGLVWTAPSAGVTAGTVFIIGNDKFTTDLGTLTGTSFGLSSGGDQIIVYEGTYYNPNYLTALSSNKWLTANTTCSGSNSMIPSALTNAVDAISHQSTKGGNGTNTMNAYYNGPTNLSAAALFTAIMDTTNWVGISIKATQIWPKWSFYKQVIAPSFRLIAPANAVDVTVDANDNTPIVISWEALENAVAYSWKIVAANGDFSKPALRIASDNSGKDTTLSLTSGAIDAALAGLSIPVGVKVDLKWTVTAYYASGDSLYADTFHTIAITRKDNTPVTYNFKAGDMAVVAYRMNASTPDEFALLTFVDIAEGMKLQFADAKFTGTDQCDDGLVWTAPAGGVKAGEVIAVLNDNPAVSKGSLTGASFGLSSAGDQIIIWEGPAAKANHITALSSNAWATTGITCASKSTSILPTKLTNGTNAISHELTTGNTTGNTVNAFYTGTMDGTFGDIKKLVADYRNWNGTAAGTEAQVWPVWNFTGKAASNTTHAHLSFQLYPNPSTGFLYFNKSIQARVFNAAGMMIMETKGQVNNLDVSALADGVYFLKNEFGATQKFSKQ